VIRILLITILACAASASPNATPPTTPTIPPPEVLLKQAQSFFQQGIDESERDPDRARLLFEQAMIRYQAIEDHAGIHNTRLLINMGNAAMLAGDVARGVLAYRRAQRLSPMDARVRDSLAQARTRVGVSFQPSLGTRLERLVLGWRGFIPRSALLITAIAGYVLLWGLALVHLLGVARWSRVLLVPAIVGTLVSLSLLLFEQRVIHNSHDAVVLTQSVALNGPSEGVYERAFDRPLLPGIEVRVIEDRDGWAHVRLIDGRRAWVRESALGAI